MVREERVEGAKLLVEEPALADRVLALLIHVLRNGLRPHLLSMLAAVLVGVPNPPRLRARPVSAPRLMALEEAARLARAPLAPRLVASGGTDVTLWRLEIADDDVPGTAEPAAQPRKAGWVSPAPPLTEAESPLAAFSNPPLTDGQSDPPSPGGHAAKPGPARLQTPPLTEEPSAVAMFRRPPLTEAQSPLALFSSPPLIEVLPPLAMLASPPPIQLSGPLAWFALPPLIDELAPLASFDWPPVTAAPGPLAELEAPAVIDADGAVMAL